MRDLVLPFASSYPRNNKKGLKLIILDEADGLSKAAQMMLRRGTFFFFRQINA